MARIQSSTAFIDYPFPIGDYRTVATLIITSRDKARVPVSHFIQNKEINSLLAISYNELGNIGELIPEDTINDARKIYEHAEVYPGYLFQFLKREMPDIENILRRITGQYVMLCQVETPKKNIPRYRNIDIGFTSNGRISKKDTSLIECSIRETVEETQIKLGIECYMEEFQKSKRASIGAEDLPYYFSYGTMTFCFILVL